ncbi:Bystin-like protein [Drosera capensis]
MIQQKEIAEEEIDERRPERAAFARLEEDGRGGVVGEEEEVVYVSDEKSELGIEWDDYETDEEEERLMESFGLLNVGPQRTLADVIAERIKQTDAAVSSGMLRVGKVLSQFTSGKIPKPFKHIPSMEPWEEVLYLTEPEIWTPNAVFAATKIFASNMGVKKAERFYTLVLLPHVREDIRKNKRLHFWLTKSLLKALYKPAAFNRGFLLLLCESQTCTVREAYIIRSVLREARIPPLHASVALLKLAQMEFCGTTSFKHELTKEDKVNLSKLVQRQKHFLITREILKELSESRNRGEKSENDMQMYILTCTYDNLCFAYVFLYPAYFRRTSNI